MAKVQSYYLSNTTFGFDPDDCFFSTRDEAFSALIANTDIESWEENERVLAITREYAKRPSRIFEADQYAEIWEISEVIDWEHRIFGDNERILLVRKPGTAYLMNLDTGEILFDIDY